MSKTLLAGAGILLFVIGVIAIGTHPAVGLISVTAYEADVNKNGAVNAQDLGLVASHFGQPVPTATPTVVPTPDTGGGAERVLARGLVIPPGQRVVVGSIDTESCPRPVLYLLIRSLHPTRDTYVKITVNGSDGGNSNVQVGPQWTPLLADGAAFDNGIVLWDPGRWGSTGIAELAIEPNASIGYAVEVTAEAHCQPSTD